MSEPAPANGDPSPQVTPANPDAPILSVNPTPTPEPNVNPQPNPDPNPGNGDPAPQPNPTPTSFINDDGTFMEGWLEGFSDGEYKDDAFLSNFKSLEGLVKTAVNQKYNMGADKLVKPGKNASEETWQEYYRAGGVPETQEGYKIEGIQLENDGDYDYNEEKRLLEFAHKNNYNNDQAEALINDNRQRHIDRGESDTVKHNERINSGKQDLINKWGGEYQKNVSMANEMMSNPAISELVKDLKLASDPRMVELLYELRLGTREDSIPDNTFGKDQISAQQELEDVMHELNGLISSADEKDIQRASVLSERAYKLRERLGGSDEAGNSYKSTQRYQ